MPEPDAGTPSLWQRIYNFLFRFLGPAQLGSFDQPGTRPADDSYQCPICGRPMSEHTYVQDAGRKRMTCPGPPSAPHA